MSERSLAVIVLAAGKGTRTRVSMPKVLLPLCGAPLLEYALDAASALRPEHIVVVLHHGMEQIQEAMAARFADAGCILVDQGEPRGTGHAAQRALAALDEHVGGPFQGDIVVSYGDMPLITPATLADLVQCLHVPHEQAHSGNGHPHIGAVASVLTCDSLPSDGYGRILRDGEGRFLGIREEKDCSPEELEIDEVNTGFYAFQGRALRECLPKLRSDNKQGEYYLTDVLGLLAEAGEDLETVLTFDPDETIGINNLAQLSEARWVMQERILLEHMDRGVIIEDPATTVIERDVEIGAETKILPFTVIRNGVRIGSHCEVGPFTHLRVGATLEDAAEVGNFVEMKKSTLGAGSKAKHLTYLGDTVIGQRANIGAGTITANYDGTNKHKTVIADGAFIGSGTIVVAPRRVGEAATTGAGAVVTKDVPDGEVHLGVPARLHRKKTPDKPPEGQGSPEGQGDAS